MRKKIYLLHIAVALTLVSLLSFSFSYSVAQGLTRIFPISWNPEGTIFAVTGIFDDQPISMQNISEVRGIDLHPNGQILAIGGRYNDQPGIWFYNLTTEMMVSSIPTTGNVVMLSWRPDGNVIAAGVAVPRDIGRPIQFFDVSSGTMIFEFDFQSSRRQVLWNNDGSQFISQGNVAYLRDGLTGEIIKTFETPENIDTPLTALAWSDIHQRLYGTYGSKKDIVVWDTISGDFIEFYPVPFISEGPELSHKEDRIAVGSVENGQVILLDALTGQSLVEIFNNEGGELLSMPVWSPDDTQIAAYNVGSSLNAIRVWDTTNGRLLHKIPAVGAISNDIVWSNDAETLIFSEGLSAPIIMAYPFGSRVGCDYPHRHR